MKHGLGELFFVSLGAVGWFYWFFMAYLLGSPMMFVANFFLIFLTAPVGLYSLFFGIPEWVIYLFG